MKKTKKKPKKKLNITKAIRRPGALTRKAKAAGMGVQAYARAHKNDKGLTGQQARFALTLKKIANKRKKKSGGKKKN